MTWSGEKVSGFWDYCACFVTIYERITHWDSSKMKDPSQYPISWASSTLIHILHSLSLNSNLLITMHCTDLLRRNKWLWGREKSKGEERVDHDAPVPECGLRGGWWGWRQKCLFVEGRRLSLKRLWTTKVEHLTLREWGGH